MAITRKFLMEWFEDNAHGHGYLADHQRFAVESSGCATLDGEWDLDALTAAINQHIGTQA